MAVIKQKTISVGNQKQTIQLKQLKNDFDRGGEYMYPIVDADTGDYIEDPMFRKREAKQEFNRAVGDIERGMKSGQSDSGGGLGLGGLIGDPSNDDRGGFF